MVLDFADITLERQYGVSVLIGERCQFVLVVIDHSDRGAFCEESVHDGVAQSGPTPGDEGDDSFHLAHQNVTSAAEAEKPSAAIGEILPVLAVLFMLDSFGSSDA